MIEESHEFVGFDAESTVRGTFGAVKDGQRPL